MPAKSQPTMLKGFAGVLQSMDFQSVGLRATEWILTRRCVGRGGGRGMAFTDASPVTEKVTAFISVGRDIFVSGHHDQFLGFQIIVWSCLLLVVWNYLLW